MSPSNLTENLSHHSSSNLQDGDFPSDALPPGATTPIPAEPGPSKTLRSEIASPTRCKTCGSTTEQIAFAKVGKGKKGSLRLFLRRVRHGFRLKDASGASYSRDQDIRTLERFRATADSQPDAGNQEYSETSLQDAHQDQVSGEQITEDQELLAQSLYDLSDLEFNAVQSVDVSDDSSSQFAELIVPFPVHRAFIREAFENESDFPHIEFGSSASSIKTNDSDTVEMGGLSESDGEYRSLTAKIDSGTDVNVIKESAAMFLNKNLIDRKQVKVLTVLGGSVISVGRTVVKLLLIFHGQGVFCKITFHVLAERDFTHNHDALLVKDIKKATRLVLFASAPEE